MKEKHKHKFPVDFLLLLFLFFAALNIAEASCMPGWFGVPKKETFSF